MESDVTMRLLARLTQKSWSGRSKTALMLAHVGGIGSEAGDGAIR